MPQFNVNAPDGSVIPVNAPDGATEQDAIAFAAKTWKPSGGKPVASAIPPEVMREPPLRGVFDSMEAPTTPTGKIGEAALGAAALSPGLGLVAGGLEKLGVGAATKFAPEIQQLLKSMQPETLKELAKSILGFGAAGASSETARQGVEAMGGGKTAQEAAELAGGAVPGVGTMAAKAIARPFLPGAAEKTAEKIVGGLSPQTEITEAAKTQADAAIKQGKEDALRRLKVAGKIEKRGEARLANAHQAKTTVIGEDRELTPIGTDIRSDVNARYEKLKSERNAKADADKLEADQVARAKEIKGRYISDEPSYNKWLDDLRGRLGLHPDVAERSIVESGQLRQINDILKSLEPKLEKQIGGDTIARPPSFEALETVRRKLGDAARGGVEKGYDAIGQQEAGDLYRRLSEEMKRFAPPFEKYLSNYRDMSKPLEVFETRTGQAAVGMEGYENNIFKTDPEGLASTYFKTPRTVARLKEMLGGDEAAVDKYASQYVSAVTRDMNSKKLKDFMRDPKNGWLKAVPSLEKRLGEYTDHLAQAEATGKRAENISKVLGTQATDAETLGNKVASSLMKKADSDVSMARKSELKSAFEKEMSSVKKTTSLGALFALPATMMMTGGATEIATLGAEAGGVAGMAQLYKQNLRAAIDEIMADPELVKLATAKNTPENVSALKIALKKSGIGAGMGATGSEISQKENK